MFKKIINEIKQIINFIFTYFPGTTGVYLRRIFYGTRLNKVGKNLLIQTGSRLTCPENITLGENVRLLLNSSLNSCKGKIKIGDDVSINVNTDINSSDGGDIEIGNNVMIGRNVYIRASDHIFKNTKNNINQSGYEPGKIKIGNNIWIGSNCVILKNVTIEDGSVVESGTVVKKNINKNEYVFSSEQINRKY